MTTAAKLLFEILSTLATDCYPDDHAVVQEIRPCSEVFGPDAVDPANPTWCVELSGVDRANHVVEISADLVPARGWYVATTGTLSLVWSQN